MIVDSMSLKQVVSDVLIDRSQIYTALHSKMDKVNKLLQKNKCPYFTKVYTSTGKISKNKYLYLVGRDNGGVHGLVYAVATYKGKSIYCNIHPTGDCINIYTQHALDRIRERLNLPLNIDVTDTLIFMLESGCTMSIPKVGDNGKMSAYNNHGAFLGETIDGTDDDEGVSSIIYKTFVDKDKLFNNQQTDQTDIYKLAQTIKEESINLQLLLNDDYEARSLNIKKDE